MPDGARSTVARVAASLMALALAGGCYAYGEVPERRPLTPTELAVRFVPGSMNVSIGLQRTCRPVGTIMRFHNAYDVRLATVAAGGNVAQFIQDVSYTHSSNYVVTAAYAASDVRFWACPVAPQPAVPVPVIAPPPPAPAPAPEY